MNGFYLRDLPLPLLDRQLAAMEAEGVRVVRADAAWADIEPAPPALTGPVWQFAKSDALVTAFATHHLTWEPLVDFAVWWAKTCPGVCPPTNDATFAAFAQAVAARYGDHGSFWAQHPGLPYYPARIFEIWNEENTTHFWSTGPNAAQYARLYIAARTAIRAVDPGASAIVGGLGDDGSSFNPQQDYPAQFVQQMFAAEPSLRGNVDGFGLHPYATTAKDAVGWVVHFRQVLDTLGEPSAPIDITEFGWPAGSPNDETWRGWMMNTMAFDLARSNCGIRLLAPYDWINSIYSHDGSADFGLVGRSGLTTKLRLAGVAWFHALKIADSQPERMLCSVMGHTRGRHSLGGGLGGGIPTGDGVTVQHPIYNIFSLAIAPANHLQPVRGFGGSCLVRPGRPWNNWVLATRFPHTYRARLTVKRACGGRVSALRRYRTLRAYVR